MRCRATDSASSRRGFTVVELLIVLTIASVMMGIAVPRIQEQFQQREVSGVRDSVILLAAEARALAMEQAQTIRFVLDTSNGVASIVDGGTTVKQVRFEAESGVEATSSLSTITLCYTSRGFATEPCSTSLGGPTEVVFSRSGYEASVEIWQLGQLRKP